MARDICQCCGRPIPSGRRLWHKTLTAEWLQQEYVTKGRSSIAISNDLGISYQTVVNALHRNGIPVRSPGRPKGMALSDEHRAKISASRLRGRA